MATFNQKMSQMLFDRGMFEKQSAQVMDAVHAAPENKDMLNRWDDEIEGYPPELVNVAWHTTLTHAIEWTEKNLPRAWFLNLLKGTIPEPIIIGAEPDAAKGEA